MSDKKHLDTKKLAMMALFAALTYVVFTYLSIPVPTPDGKVSITLGNTFVVLGALLMGPSYGAVAGAIGLTLADLFDPVYIVEAPVTFLVKFLLGWIAGSIAWNIGHIDKEEDAAKIRRYAIIATVAALVFNTVADPGLRYIYKRVILGRTAAEVSFAINIAVTALNAAVSAVVTVALYLALRTALKKAGLLARMS